MHYTRCIIVLLSSHNKVYVTSHLIQSVSLLSIVKCWMLRRHIILVWYINTRTFKLHFLNIQQKFYNVLNIFLEAKLVNHFNLCYQEQCWLYFLNQTLTIINWICLRAGLLVLLLKLNYLCLEELSFQSEVLWNRCHNSYSDPLYLLFYERNRKVMLLSFSTASVWLFCTII